MEVEVKFAVENPDEIERIVEEMAEFVIDKEEYDLYFNHPCRDFAETDEALRVRRDVEGVTLTYKGRKVDPETKTREEIKVRLDDFDRMVAILGKLGFRVAGEVRKRRKIYRDGSIVICIDRLEGIGSFVELEIESDDVEGAKERLFEYAEKLGLSREKSIRTSYLEMVLNVADSDGKG
ncbi:adenylyl cyclase CyaB, putative [Geoglobus ahangari]|uniref:Adenylyl cyclase CyaB, putative n=1 Tax=Geoglobus ahangari TaxID=113653 RepID=A0A0F7IH09_9EURY|nr:class IV adenylate cyclase [Geoglobus ahangari]AKG92173.1 adenylyl cyclase CyaB, putative [Geoglobus ahangari]